MDFDSVKDSGQRQEFETGSRRDTDEGKPLYDLIPAYALERLAMHFANGARKYGERNWEKGQPLMRYIRSAMRHMESIRRGETDEDHEAAVVWNIMCFTHTKFMIEHFVLPQELDDYTASIVQHRSAAEFDQLKEVTQELRDKGSYVGWDRPLEQTTIPLDKQRWTGSPEQETNRACEKIIKAMIASNEQTLEALRKLDWK